MFLLLVLSLSTIPCEAVTTSRVDVVEINHFYDGDGKHQIDQLILYDWCPVAERFQVCKAFTLGSGYGRVRGVNIDHNKIIFNGGGKLRSIQFSSFRETWSQEDPELAERLILPISQRKDLP